MNQLPSISIVIPTYNEEKNITRCLSSIFKQQYKGKLQVFIVDGGSTDQTINQAKTFRVKVLRNPYKQAEYGKKIGLMKSTGKYFMILDCDMVLVGAKWFEKMIEPLEADKTIVGSWTKFVSRSDDAPLNKFITLDPIQRDPLFLYLTASINSRVVSKNEKYWTVTYSKNKMLPAGFCLFRRKQILLTVIKNMKKYMELDNLVILFNKGWSRFAYVQDIGIHHPFLTTLSNLAKKRVRNIQTMYFNQPDKRYWTWIDWHNWFDIFKIFLWLVYCYTLVPSILVGLYKSVKNRTWTGCYELPFNIISTNAIIRSFVAHLIT